MKLVHPLFLTFSCDNFASNYHYACRFRRPWEDLFIFTSHFKERWIYFFGNCISKEKLYNIDIPKVTEYKLLYQRFATIAGGITNSL